MKNKILVQICDKEYSILTDEPDEDYVKTLAHEITDMIEDRTYRSLRISKLDAAMLTCLALSDKIHKLSEDNENMRREILGYVDEIGKLSKKLATFERQKPAKSTPSKLPAEAAAPAENTGEPEEAVTEEAAIDDNDESVKSNVPVYRQF